MSTAQRDAARHVRELLRRRSLAQLCELLDPFDSTWAGVLYDAAETTLISGDPLSSESIAPFVLDGRTYNSVWCFYQSLKPPPGDTRGQEAAAGRRRRLRGGGRTAFVYEGQEIAVNAPAHGELVARATAAKVYAHERVRLALAATGARRLYMGDVRSQALGRFMPFALMVLRYKLFPR